MFDIDYHPKSYTPEQLADYLLGVGSQEDVVALVSLLSKVAGVQRQSGMEGKHERWVLETLNFLNGMEVPFFRTDERGNRLPGEAGQRDIPERLTLLRQRIASERARDLQVIRSQDDKITQLNAALAAAHRVIQFYEDFASVIKTEVERLNDWAKKPLAAPPAECPPDPPRS